MLITRLSILRVHTAISADHMSEYFMGLWVHTAVYADHKSEYFIGAHRNFC